MNNTKCSTQSIGVKLANFFISTACVSVSIAQGGAFVASMASDDRIMKIMLYTATAALLCGALNLSIIIGHAIKTRSPVWMILLGILTMFGISCFSVYTSTNSLAKKTNDKILTENQNSAEYLAAKQSMSNMQRQLDSIQQKMNELPVGWVTATERLEERYRSVEANMQAKAISMTQIQGSTTNKTFENIGLPPELMALVFALLLDLVPLVTGLLIGYESDNRRVRVNQPMPGEGMPGKKYQAQFRAAV